MGGFPQIGPSHGRAVDRRGELTGCPGSIVPGNRERPAALLRAGDFRRKRCLVSNADRNAAKSVKKY